MTKKLRQFRFLALSIILIAGVFLWPGVKHGVQVDNSLTVWFLEDDPALVPYREFQERFGNDEMVVLLIKDKKTLLSVTHFQKFLALTKDLEALPEVAQVIGPGNTEIISGKGIATKASSLLKSTSTADQVKSTLQPLPTLRTQLYNQDYTAARFLITLHALPDFDTRRGEILEKVNATIAHHYTRDAYHLGGVGILFAAMNTLSQQDFGFFLGLGYLMMFLLFWWIYRKPLLLVYALGTVALATYFTLGIYGALGYRLNLMTTLLPIIIILLGIMDVMHVLNERNQMPLILDKSPTKAALKALKKVFRPCLFTSITTMAGFLALMTSPMAILKIFGAFAALGILLCFFFTYLLGVLLLPLTQPAVQATQKTGQWLHGLSGFLTRRKTAITLFTLVVLLVSVAGIFQIKSDTYTLGYFPEQHQVVKDHEAMEKHWGPYMPLELLVKPKPGYTLSSPALVQAAFSLTDSVAQWPGMGQPFGFHTLYLSGLEMGYGDKARRMLSSNYYLTQLNKELTGSYQALAKPLLHQPSQTGRISLAGEMASASELTSRLNSVLKVSEGTLGKVAEVTPAGYQPLYAHIVRYVAISQTYSLLLAVVLVFLLVWLFIKDLRLALLSVVPNTFPILLMLGVMGWADINLDTATASIAAIVLSFCIDDTIHFIYHYRKYKLKGLPLDQARNTTLQHVGPAIVLTSVVLFMGYALMIFGSLKTVELFGMLTAIAIAAALYSQLFIFPLLLEKFDKDANPK